MQRLYTTTSKDDYAILLDILGIQSIYEEHTITLNENSENQYNVFVKDEDFDKANEILNEQDWEEDYSQYDEKTLVDELMYQSNDTEKKEKIKTALLQKGVDEDEIHNKIEQEIIHEYEPLHISASKLLLLYLGAMLLGLGFPIGLKILFSKSNHPITKKRFHTFDKDTRNHARFMLIIGNVVFAALIYIWYR